MKCEMDHSLQRQLFRPYLIPNNVRLTSFQLPSSNLMPGMGLASANPSLMIPLHSESLFNHTKVVEAQPKVVSKFDTQKVLAEEPTFQQGSGKLHESEENTEDIDLNSGKQVSENILSAFQKPIMRTAVVEYKPPELVSKIEGKKTKKIPQISKLKFV